MPYAVIDTVAAGEFDFHRPADADGQPPIAHFAILRLDDEMNLESEHSYFIRGGKLTQLIREKYGLAQADVDAGVPIREALTDYVAAIDEGRIIVAQGAQHDVRHIQAALNAEAMPSHLLNTRAFCLMRSLTGRVVKGNGKKGWPSLQESCAAFNVPLPEAPNALDGARAAAMLLKVGFHDAGIPILPIDL